jgi:hypothetical protein
MSQENNQQKQIKPLEEASIVELKAAAFDLQQQLQAVMQELQSRINLQQE